MVASVHHPRIISFEHGLAIHKITQVLEICPPWYCLELADEIEEIRPLLSERFDHERPEPAHPLDS